MTLYLLFNGILLRKVRKEMRERMGWKKPKVISLFKLIRKESKSGIMRAAMYQNFIRYFFLLRILLLLVILSFPCLELVILLLHPVSHAKLCCIRSNNGWFSIMRQSPQAWFSQQRTDFDVFHGRVWRFVTIGILDNTDKIAGRVIEGDLAPSPFSSEPASSSAYALFSSFPIMT